MSPDLKFQNLLVRDDRCLEYQDQNMKRLQKEKRKKNKQNQVVNTSSCCLPYCKTIGPNTNPLFNLYPPKGRFLWRISFKFSPKASFDILNNILESGFDFHVSSLGSTNVPMWERWERDDKILPDFENMKKTCSSKAKC